MGVSRELQLLHRDMLVKTSEVDQADWNYRPLLGLIQRTRFRLVAELLGTRRFDRLLEVGYGSGVFMPQLRRHCDELYGIDIHPHIAEVGAVLERAGVEANLTSASATSIPFESSWFDCIVAVSCVEFIDDLGLACKELHRVLAPDGRLIVVTPGESPLLDLGLTLLTRRSATVDFGERRRRVEKNLAAHFTVEERRTFPGLPSVVPQLYSAYLLRA